MQLTLAYPLMFVCAFAELINSLVWFFVGYRGWTLLGFAFSAALFLVGIVLAALAHKMPKSANFKKCV